MGQEGPSPLMYPFQINNWNLFVKQTLATTLVRQIREVNLREPGEFPMHQNGHSTPAHTLCVTRTEITQHQRSSVHSPFRESEIPLVRRPIVGNVNPSQLSTLPSHTFCQ